MKITGATITQNTTIKVSGWELDKDLGKVYSWETEERQSWNKYRLENDILFDVPNGAVKENSPILRVNKVESYTYFSVIHTDKGTGVVGNNNKVELI
mgnify:FL=1|tara:strand:+ start:245 stop:535 length:291 start_codon:yes stop_codon:yes gene_type:complete